MTSHMNLYLAFRLLGALLILLPLNLVHGELVENWEELYQEKCKALETSKWQLLKLTLEGKDTKTTEETLRRDDVEYQNYQHDVYTNITEMSNITSEELLIKEKYIKVSDQPGSLGTNILHQYELISKEVDSIYKDQKICVEQECHTLFPDLSEAIKAKKDPEERLNWWMKARETVEEHTESQFKMILKLMNDMASMNGLDNMVSQWEWSYDKQMWSEAERLWEKILPAYEVIHAWVRMKLRNSTGQVNSTRIPAHLLGDVWGQDWGSNLPFNFFSDKSSTDMMEFFRETLLDMGLTSIPSTFQDDAIVSKKPCWPKVNGYCTGEKVGFLQCSHPGFSGYNQLLHQIGEYLWQKRTLSLDYTFRQIRKSENPDLYVGLTRIFDLILADKWNQLGKLQSEASLIEDIGEIDESLQPLLHKALTTFGYLSYQLSLGVWRRNIILNSRDFNEEWWKTRIEIQGVDLPEGSTYENHFDALHPDIFSIQDNFRYFLGEIDKFQIFKSLCINASEYTDENSEKPLHQCALYKNEDVGKKLGQAMEVGSSRPSAEVLESLTGKAKRCYCGLLDYFKPLTDHMRHELEAANEKIGWEGPARGFSSTDILIIGVVLLVLLVLMTVFFFLGRRRARVLRIGS